MVEFAVYNSGRGGSFEDMKRVWLEAERLGFDQAWCADNVVGPLEGAETAEAFDFWSVGGALAEATSRIRIGPLATPCGRRHPALFAKMTSMLDVISGGRLEVAMGPGDHGWQFLQWGQSYPSKTSERIAILSEEIEILKLMWTQERSRYEGKYYRLEGACNSPKPIQKPHPPLWVGVALLGKRLMPRLAAKYADGVNFISITDEELKRRLDTIAGYCRELGRDYEKIKKSNVVRMLLTEKDADYSARWKDEARSLGVTEDYMRWIYGKERRVWGPPERAIEELCKIIDIGIDQLVMRFGGGWMAGPDSELAGMRIFAEKIMPALRAKYRSPKPAGTNTR